MRPLRILATSPLTSWFFKLGYKFFYRFKFELDLIPIQKEIEKKQSILNTFSSHFENLTVLSGPFKGLKYPSFYSHGSALYPKLLGTYENELHEVIEKLSSISFSSIIDVGCAEGYYAVGLSKIFPNSKIIAVDVSEKARLACQEMFKINDISANNYSIMSAIDVINLPLKNTLIVMDCEGCEYDFFSEDIIHLFKDCYFIIELHDLKNEKISPRIKELFANTHSLNFIYSVNPLEKIGNSILAKELLKYSKDELLVAFSERSGIMQWVVMTPKKN